MSPALRPSIAETARRAWGEPPDWIVALADSCDASNQTAVAALLGYSRTVVSLLVNNKYDRDLRAAERTIRRVLMRVVVHCPVLGDIPDADCAEHQARPYSPANPTRVRLYGACHGGCPHFTGDKS